MLYNTALVARFFLCFHPFLLLLSLCQSIVLFNGAIMRPPQQSLGNIYISLQFLPRWYQMCAIGGIVILVCLRHNPIIVWLLTAIHMSFGTQYLWYSEYQQLLEKMAFVERMGFTFYGVALGSIVFVCAQKIIFRFESFSKGEFFNEKPAKNYFCFFLLCVVQTFLLRKAIRSSFTNENSSAYFALRSLQGLHAEDFQEDKTLSSSMLNQHFIIQGIILCQIIKRFLLVHVPVFLVSVAYRCLKDVSSGVHTSLRWYMATYCSFFSLLKLLKAFYVGDWCDAALLVSCLNSVLYVGMVNFSYGTAKRAGTTKSKSKMLCIQMTVGGLGICFLIWALCLLVMLSVCVSVHVFDVIMIWLGIILSIVWFPASIDSFSANHIMILSAMAGYIGNCMTALTFGGAVRFSVLLTANWITLCVLFNLLVLYFCSRTSAVVAIALIGGAVGSVFIRDSTTHRLYFSALKLEAQVADRFLIEQVALSMIRWAVELCNLESGRPAPGIVFSIIGKLLHISHDSALCTYTGYIVLHVFLIASLLGLIKFYSRYGVTSANRKKMQRLSISPITPTLFLEFVIRGVASLAVGFIFAGSFTVVKEYIVPRYAMIQALPDMLVNVLAFFVACMTLGFLDCSEAINETIQRSLGLQEPPAKSFDHSDDDIQIWR